jgi:AraC-like DNA-binding protein
MTTAHDIDWPAVLADRLTTTHPDVLRELLSTCLHTLMGAEAIAGAERPTANGPTSVRACLSNGPPSRGAPPFPHDRTDHQPVLLRRAIEFIDANVIEDIALAEIAEAAYLTPRAVQYMFRRHLHSAPMQYLRRLRLHYAHQELRAADRTQDTVTAIAAHWGFMDTSRFAVLYRQTYGQRPHTTLRE